MSRSTSIAILLCVWIVGSVSSSAQNRHPSVSESSQQDQLTRGRQLMEQGDIVNARRCFESIPESSPDYFHALANLAIAERIQGHLDRSVRLFEESMDRFEVSRQQRMDQIRQQIRSVRKKLAEIPIQLPREHAEPEPDPQAEQRAESEDGAELEQLTDRLHQLEQRFARIQKMPYPASYSFELGNTLFEAMTFQQALEAFAAAVKADDKFGPAYVKLSVCYFLFNNCEKAKWAHEMALQLGQSFPGQFEDDLNARCGE